MAGPRYTDWTHVHYVGDRDEASLFLPEARKLLGFVVEDAAHNKLQTHQVTRRYPDGATIVAELRGGIPRVTIVPGPKPAGDSKPDPRDSFVVWPRDEANPNGIDPDNPQLILRPSWKTYFYSPQIPGYLALNRPKGTFIGMFNNGVNHAGNVDWRGSDGERLSWAGPSTRYWYDPFVQMVAQYGRKVFMLGQVVLDTDAYITASSTFPNAKPAFNERYVLGAARRGAWLYVVQVQAHNLSVEIPKPEQHNPPNARYIMIGQSYTLAPVATVLCRYRVEKRADGTPGVTVVPKSREVLWSGTIERNVAPWMFSPDGLRAKTILPPQAPLCGPAAGNTGDAASDVWQADIAFSQNGTPSATVSMVQVAAAPNGSAPMAFDYDDDGTEVTVELVRRSGEAEYGWDRMTNRNYLRCAGAELLLRDLVRIADDGYSARYLDTRRRVMFADARAGVVVARKSAVTFYDPPGSNPPGGSPFISTVVTLEVWMGGVLVHEYLDGNTAPTDANESYGVLSTYNSIGDNQPFAELGPMAPLMPLYGWHLTTGTFGAVLFVQPAHAGYTYLRYQHRHYFGYVLEGRITSGGVDVPSQRAVVADYVNATPASEKLDRDGMDSILGCATYKGELLLSAYPKCHGDAPADTAVISKVPRTLGQLTNVTGANVRYHPIWLLGKPPKGALA